MKELDEKSRKRIYGIKFSTVHPLYVKKVERKGRTRAEVDEVTRWLTGYTQKQIEAHIEKESDFEHFFAKARLNPKRKQVTGMICGVRVEEIKDPTYQAMRYLDKLVDELAKGRPMEKILRSA